MVSTNKKNNNTGPSANTRSKVSISEVDYNALEQQAKKKTGAPTPTIKKPEVKTHKTNKKSLGAIIIQGILSGGKPSGPKSSDRDSDCDSEESWMEDYTEEEVEYLEALDEKHRIELIAYENELRESKKPPVPLRFKILKSDLSDGAKYLILNKLDEMGYADDIKINQWVDGLAMVPFGKYAEPTVSIADGKQAVFQFLKKANDCLNESIYGHDEAKAQILEYIAQYVTNPRSNGKCLALQGPPGNGKTTLVRNGVAKAIGRPFAQISLGGANDVSVLSGHDFTYEGSQCGRIVTILRETGIMNPVFYFDELDKVSTTHRGEDIYNFLCHLTDFSQNCAYHDKYYEGIDIDLSKAIFIFSFNDITRINPILLDRLHVIQTKGFGLDEKVSIAKNYLIPAQMKEIGLEDVQFTDEALRDIIVSHCKEEQGVRKLKRMLEGVLTKLNILQFVKMDSGIKLPYDIPDLTFPIKVDHRILSKLVKEEQSFSKHMMMYT